MDYNWAREVGLIRRPATFVTSMTDERGDELMYAGVKISEVVESGNGIGGVMALLWFQVWSLTQFHSVDFTKSRIDVKRCIFQQTHNQGLRKLLLTVFWDLCA